MAGTPKSTAGPAPAWLLFVHQLPAQPSNLRVKTWRRLQGLGAVAVKNGVYALPHTEQAREDLEWMQREVESMRGQATVFAADHLDAVSGDEIRAGFRASRQQDYDLLGRDLARLRARLGRPRRGATEALRHEVAGLRERWGRIAAIDFFAAPGREATARALDGVAELLARSGGQAEARKAPATARLRRTDYRGRVWVTRPRPGIDRLGSAWLIRRFIDARARFRFADHIEARSADVPFDTYTGEFSHQGGRCTFEVLAARFGIDTPGVERLGRIVHDIDLKDDRFGLPESAAMQQLVVGLRLLHADDMRLLESGIEIFEALYRAFSEGGEAGASRRRR